MSNRAAEYRLLIEDVIAGGLLDEDEIAEMRDLLARVKRNMEASRRPADAYQEAGE